MLVQWDVVSGVVGAVDASTTTAMMPTGKPSKCRLAAVVVAVRGRSIWLWWELADAQLINLDYVKLRNKMT